MLLRNVVRAVGLVEVHEYIGIYPQKDSFINGLLLHHLLVAIAIDYKEPVGDPVAFFKSDIVIFVLPIAIIVKNKAYD
jgi:hypothetical protein